VILVVAGGVVWILVAQPRDQLVDAVVAMEGDRVGGAEDLDVPCGEAHLLCPFPGLLPGMLVALLTTGPAMAFVFAVNTRTGHCYFCASLIQ
jgi:hypothetical protein